VNTKHVLGYVCLASAVTGLLAGVSLSHEQGALAAVVGVVAVVLGGASFRLLAPARSSS
jgi:hypothetical protein